MKNYLVGGKIIGEYLFLIKKLIFICIYSISLSQMFSMRTLAMQREVKSWIVIVISCFKRPLLFENGPNQRYAVAEEIAPSPILKHIKYFSWLRSLCDLIGTRVVNSVKMHFSFLHLRFKLKSNHWNELYSCIECLMNYIYLNYRELKMCQQITICSDHYATAFTITNIIFELSHYFELMPKEIQKKFILWLNIWERDGMNINEYPIIFPPTKWILICI